MTGTWNVAGIAPSDDLDLDQWLCTQEPADLYVLGYVPLQNMKNVSFDLDKHKMIFNAVLFLYGIMCGPFAH